MGETHGYYQDIGAIYPAFECMYWHMEVTNAHHIEYKNKWTF